MQINLSLDEVNRYAAEYNYADDALLVNLMNAAIARGYMTRVDLAAVATWKWRGGRTRQLCAKNTEADVKEVTKISFAANSERLRIGALLALDGVQWPMASVILHFGFPDQYPILDKRTMKSVGGSSNYTIELWKEYTDLCVAKAIEYNVSLRCIDKALWVRGGKKT